VSVCGQGHYAKVILQCTQVLEIFVLKHFNYSRNRINIYNDFNFKIFLEHEILLYYDAEKRDIFTVLKQ